VSETDRHAQVNNLPSILFFTARRVYATYMHGAVCSMALYDCQSVCHSVHLGLVFETAETIIKLEMWANAQRDGRPAEYRWRPLFNAAKFG